MPLTRITRRMEFDAGHRIPEHGSKCRNLHGHRYRIEATVEGEVSQGVGAADEGMIIDFGILKAVMDEVVVTPWDHAFLVYENDTAVTEMLDQIPGHKTVELDVVPTAENMAAIAFELIDRTLRNRSFALQLVHVRLYETPNCWADVYAQIVDGMVPGSLQTFDDDNRETFYDLQPGDLSDDGTDGRE